MASLSFPNNPTDGQVYSGSNGVRYQYIAARQSWRTGVTPTPELMGANPSSTAPLNPVNGSFWLDTDSNSLHVYHAATAQWLAIAGAASAADTSGLALEGSAVYDGTVVLEDVGVNLELIPAT